MADPAVGSPGTAGLFRQPWTYWLRLLTALGAVSVLAIMAMTGQHRLGQADGLSLFAGSTVTLFFIASLNGLRSTSDCIASERRQGTLVLLFLADLKLNTILMSKLVTNFMRNAWAFLGTLPVLGLCLLLLLLPASFHALRIASPARITVLLVLAYWAIAVVMHRKLGRLVQGGDTVHGYSAGRSGRTELVSDGARVGNIKPDVKLMVQIHRRGTSPVCLTLLQPAASLRS